MEKMFCEIIKERIRNSHFYKFGGIAPEGFVLITEKSFEKLRNFDDWKVWKNNPNIIEIWMKEELKNY